jgi:hypothetical protein
MRFFGFAPASTAPAPAAFAGVNASIAPIHLGVGGSSPSRGLPRHWRSAIRRTSTPSTIFSTSTHVAGSPPSLAFVGCATSRTTTPTTARPTSQPPTKAGPFARARDVVSMTVTAMIGRGLNATPTASESS